MISNQNWEQLRLLIADNAPKSIIKDFCYDVDYELGYLFLEKNSESIYENTCLFLCEDVLGLSHLTLSLRIYYNSKVFFTNHWSSMTKTVSIYKYILPHYLWDEQLWFDYYNTESKHLEDYDNFTLNYLKNLPSE